MIDSSMLPDFIVEAAEHLEEMESSLLRLEQDYNDKEVLDEIFRSIHTIKGAAQFVGIERVSELSHKMENLLDLIRRSEITLNTAITDLLIAGKDRLTLLVDELERTQGEETEVADLVEQLRRIVEGDAEPEPVVDEAGGATESFEEEGLDEEPEGEQVGVLAEESMSDEYDEELYNIFLQQLKENIPFLYAQTVELSISVDKQDVLYRCSDSIKSLKSSANYMGYEKLTQHYSNWQHAIENAVEQLSSGKMPDLSFMQDYLDEIIRSFPQAMDGYSQDDVDALGSDIGEEKQDVASIDSALNSIFADEGPATATDELASMGDFDSDAEEDEEEENQGIDLDRALDSIFSDEFGGLEDEEEEEPDPLHLDDAPLVSTSTSEPVVYDNKSSQVDAGRETGVDTVPLEYELYDDEYDEELISIFLKKLKTDIEYIQARIAEYRVGGDKRTILENCHDAIGRLASSANYMEYGSLTDFCELWQGVVDGYHADIATGVDSDIAAGMQEFVDKIVGVYPQITGDNKPEELDEFDDEDVSENIFSVADESEAASEDLQSKEKEVSVPPEPPRKKEEVQETKTVAQTNNEQDDHSAGESGDKELFDKLSSALEVSEYAATTSPDSIDTVIEEIIEAPGTESRQGQDSKNDSGMDLSQLVDKVVNGGMGTSDSGAHLLDKVVASKEPEEEQEKAKEDSLDASEVEEEEVQKKSQGADTPAEEKPEEQHNEPVAVTKTVDFIKSEILKQEAEQEEKEATPTKKATVRSSIRVDADKIDYLMNQVGELVVSRAYFAQLVNEMRGLEQQLLESSGVTKGQLKPLHEFSFRLSEAGVHLGRVSNELQEGVMKVRMLPIDQLFKRYPRLVRDLVHNSDKDVKLVTKGEETELDKMVIESISDPLIHIIRNSVDHGIETIEERLRVGKPAQGTLLLEAFHESDHIVLEITDDGKGIDTARIRKKALEKSLVRKEELERMSDQELTRLIMLPGFSTAEKATKTSGRGVGMDVVKKNIEKLNGTVEIVSEVGKGTRLRIKIPLTMAIIQALMVRVGQEKFTIPLTTVEETLRVFRHEISEIEGVDVIHLRENTMPIFQLSKIYNIDRQGLDEDKMFVVVVSTGTQELGIVVDELLGQEEVVIKPLADYLRVESGFGGATILGDGGISLILDIPELVKIAKENQVLKQEQRSLNFKRKKGSTASTTQLIH
ncbi:MAG: chemotaxis protein CheW [Candidatus Electrothrix scaldis]|nr:MAG: chemotaxis protein CheW [Candidatus Electrothrix sp. GW3-3]